MKFRYEVQTYDDYLEVESVDTFDTYGEAWRIYYLLAGKKAIIKVNDDGEPIEEIKSNF